MKTTYVSSCIDTGVRQLNMASILLFIIFGFLFSILPPTLPVIMLAVLLIFVIKKMSCLYLHYKSEYRALSKDEKEMISLYFKKHHHAFTLFTLPIKCFIMGILVFLLSDCLIQNLTII